VGDTPEHQPRAAQTPLMGTGGQPHKSSGPRVVHTKIAAADRPADLKAQPAGYRAQPGEHPAGHHRPSTVGTGRDDRDPPSCDFVPKNLAVIRRFPLG